MFVFILFLIFLFIIFWGMIGYPLFVILLGKVIIKENLKSDNIPKVTIMVVAHNEEKVIKSNILKRKIINEIW